MSSSTDGQDAAPHSGSPLFDRMMLDTLPGAVWVIDADGRTSYANAALADRLGAPVEEVVGHPAAPHLRARSARAAATSPPSNWLAAEFRTALDEDQCWVAYQPVTDLDGQLHSVEALARWNHPDRGAIPPSEFVPMAEQHNLVGELFVVVLAEACRDIARWRGLFPDLTVSVNLSARQLTDPDLVPGIQRALSAVELDPSALCLEVTETAVMADFAAAVASLSRLRDLGVRVAIDDFGTGYSSLLYLRQLPANVLKLDRFFVAELAGEGHDRDIVGFMINLADTLGLQTVAEGVETAGQLSVLRDLGCTLTQGFYWSKPQSAAAIDDLLRRGTRLDGSDYDENVAAGHLNPVATKGSTTSLDARRVLLVDDSDGQRSLQRIILESSGRYRVTGEARTGEEAIELARAAGADLVLLDLAMPGRNGLEVLPDLAAAAPSAHIVVCSGYVSPATAETARTLGAAACLDKALSPDQLVEALDALVPVS